MNQPFNILPPRQWTKVDGGWILQGGIIFNKLDECQCTTCKQEKNGQAAQFFGDLISEDEIEKKKLEFLEFERKHMVL